MPLLALTSNGVPAGSFVLTAIAADNYGARATNSVSMGASRLPAGMPSTVQQTVSAAMTRT